MNRRGVLLLLGVMLLAQWSCSQPKVDVPSPSVEIPELVQSRTIIGDGLELRCFRITTSLDELHRVILGIGGQLISVEKLVLGGFEFYEVPAARVDDFTSVVSDGRAWNTRWLGQQFDWTNLLPNAAPYVDGDFQGWLALPGRSWSTMMEDGPVVVLEAVPVVGTQQIGWGGERPMDQFRFEYVLRPGRALVLFGGSGLSLEHEIVVADQEQVPDAAGQTVGQQLMMARSQNGPGRSEIKPEATVGSALILLPQFTSGRRMPPPSSPR